MLSPRRLNQVKAVIADPRKKPALQMAAEALHCAIRRREIPWHYITRLAYRRGAPHYLDFLSNSEIKDLLRRLNFGGPVSILSDKLLFQLFCEKHGIPVPRMLGYLTGRSLVEEGGGITTGAPERIRERLLALVESVESGALFAKPVHGKGGESVMRFDKTLLRDGASAFARLCEAAETTVYVVQEAVAQHPEVAAVYPLSVNTVRMDTVAQEDGTIDVVSAFMRFGAGRSFVDNCSTGGIFVGVDLASGTLRSVGGRALELGGGDFVAHPDTKVEFGGRPVPHLGAAQELVRRAAALIPAVPLIGWDVAIRPDGPILVEGNHNYSINAMEIASGGYRAHPAFRRLLERRR